MTDPRHGSYRRIATEEAFSVPEVHDAMRDWSSAAAPDEPDQDFWRSARPRLELKPKRKIFYQNAERVFQIAPADVPRSAR